MKNKISRRQFIKASAAASFGVMILPRWAACKEPGPNSIFNVAVVGPGGQGSAAIRAFKPMSNAKMVAFCDVDDARAAKAYEQYPDIARFKDYRIMLDKMGKDIDGVSISTPDHTHYPIGAWSMANGKHVVIEKPMARTLWETQELKRIAKKTKLITQMANQGHTMDGWRQVREWYEAGILGEIVEIHHWTNRPFWPQGKVPRPDGTMQIPEGFDFNLWLNVAPDQAYGESTKAFNWRGLQDFGTGSLGDMGCHFMDLGYSAFDLGFPTSVTGACTEFNDYSWPQKASVVYDFPANSKRKGIKVYWYDDCKSGNRPHNIKDIPQEKIDSMLNGSIIVGTKATVMSEKPQGTSPMIWPLEKHREYRKENRFPKASIPRVEGGPHQEWVRCCIEGKQPCSNFVDVSSDFTAVVMMGLIANFFPAQRLDFDAKKMQFSNVKDANLHMMSRYRYKQEFLPGKI